MSFPVSLLQIKSGLQALLSQGFTEPCRLCQRSANHLFCVDCWRQIQGCPQSPLFEGNDPTRFLALGIYQGSLKRAIAALKYANQPEIGYALGQCLGQAWLRYCPQVQRFWVVPIPLHCDRFQQRGYNQSVLIAKGFAQTLDLPLKAQGLRRIRATQAQHALSPDARQRNLTGAFAIGSDLKSGYSHQPIVLIDDIFTTGSTLAEAQRVLKQAHWNVMGTAVLAQACLN